MLSSQAKQVGVVMCHMTNTYLTVVASELIQARADVHMSMDDHGATPLFVASQEGHAGVVSALLAARASPDGVQLHGYTPLAAASYRGQADVVAVLLVARAAVNLADEDGHSPLYIACWQGHRDIAASLILAGAALEQPDNEGDTPMSVAEEAGHDDVVDLLLAQGASPFIHESGGVFFFEYFFTSARQSQCDIILACMYIMLVWMFFSMYRIVL